MTDYMDFGLTREVYRITTYIQTPTGITMNARGARVMMALA